LKSLHTLQHLGTPALVAVFASALVGITVVIGRRRLERCAPAVQSRLLLAAALTPAFLTTIIFVASVADWLLSGPAAFCLEQSDSSHPSISLLLLFSFFFSRVAILGFRFATDVRRAANANRAFLGASTGAFAGCRVLPIDEPQAFVLGILKPHVYLSQVLLATLHPDDLRLVLAHEKAHARRRDPLRRFVAAVGLLFHLPGIAAMLNRRLARSQEMTADAEAASKVEERPRLAEALVRFARLRVSPATIARMEFLNGDLEARVQELLDSSPRTNAPSTSLIISGFIALCVLSFFAAHLLHHLSISLLNLP
jgi:Zn-dependent protease with chaperone function